MEKIEVGEIFSISDDVNEEHDVEVIATLELEGTQYVAVSFVEDLEDENTIDRPDKIFPKPGSLQSEQSKKECVFRDELPSMSFRLYKHRYL